MGKTFVALGIAYSVAIRSPSGPIVVMVPAIHGAPRSAEGPHA
jgi:hypothetical protein